MSWLEKNLPTVLAAPATLALLGYLAKAFPVVWGALRRTEEIARLIVELTQAQAELKAERQEHLKTLRAWQSWRLKYGPTLESDSSRPPSS